MDLKEKHTETPFQQMLEYAPVALILVNKEGKIVFSNNEAEKLFGYNKSELIAQSIELLIPARFSQHHPEHRNDIFKTPEPRYMGYGRDLFALKRDGTEFPAEIGLNPIGSGEDTMVLAAIMDITERKKAEDHRALFASIVDSSDDAILSKTLDGVITGCNKGAERLFGYTEEEIKGKNVSILIPADRIHEENEIIGKIRKGEHVHHYETQRKKKDGSLVFISLTVSPIVDKNGKIIGASKIARDITDRKLAESKILKANKLYSFLSAINQAIVHAGGKQFLLDEVCQIATVIGKFEMAWVGFYDNNGQSIALAAQSNATEYDKSRFRFLKFDGDGPLAKVYKTGKYYLGNQTDPGPSREIWEDYSKKRGFGSYIILPINKARKVIGAFTVYSSVPNFFDDEEIALLSEAAGDISFAMDNFERDALMTQSEKRLKGAQQMAHLGDWEFDLKTKNVSWSDEHFRIYGLEPGSTVPSLDLALKFVHPQDVDRISGEIKNALSNFTPISHFRRIILGNGELRHIYATALFDFDESNVPVSFHGTTLDVTDITKIEDDLRKSELKFRDLFDNAPEAILIADLSPDKASTFIMGNYNASKLLKYTIEELTEKTLADISPMVQPDGRSSDEKAKGYIAACIQGEKPVFEWNTVNSKGEEFICEVRLVNLTGMGRDVFMASFIDITERKNSEQLKDKLTRDLIIRNKDLEQFTYIVSHNLRGPLANLLGTTEILQMDGLDPEMTNSMISSLSSSVNRLDDVIKDLNYILQVKREVSEKNELLKFSKTVKDIIVSMSNLIMSDHVKIITDFDEVDEFFGLKSYLHSIFYNLISNSIKYRKPEISPKIEIKSSLLKNKIVLTFKDNGLGIDLEKKGNQVFGLYKRFHLHKEGKGMGLYMTKTQVETMGGNISVSSKVNEGTTFRIEFELSK